ncbi:MAG TPA: response regulator [Terriglobales bacterium]|jgi:CheY-like chemotaxis protein|nr:response regulator [Terriglobales bacterium]
MARKPTILCVDDRADSLLIRKLMLQQFGCEVVTVTDAPACLDALDQHPIDLILIDYHLSGKVNGEELSRTIRESWPKVALIMLTGDPNVPVSARESVDALLIKGASSPNDMLDLIENLVPDAELLPRVR